MPISGRIAYAVSHGLSYASNGYAVRTQGIAKALNEHGLEILCFIRPGRPWELHSQRGPVPLETGVQNVRYIHSRWPQGKRPQNEQEHLEYSAKIFEELFRVYRPAAVLAASNWIVALPAWVAARRLGLPFYNEVRGFWELSRDAREPGYAAGKAGKLEAQRDTFVARQANKVFTLSNSMRAELVERGLESSRIGLVPNGVSELPDIKPPDPGLKERLGIQDGDKVIGYIGSFNPYEGLDVLIQACDQLVKKGEQIKLLLVGDNQPVTKAMNVISNIAAKPWLIQVGRVPHEEIADYYGLIDTVVIPRNKLPVCEKVPPMKAAEALAHGKRLVVSDVGPLAEFATKHQGTVTFTSGDVSSLSAALSASIRCDVTPARSPDVLFSDSIEPLLSALGDGASENKTRPAHSVLSRSSESLAPAVASTAKPGTEKPGADVFAPPSAQAAEISILGWPEYPPNGKPYVIGIMDEFTTGCFEQDLNLIQPRPDNWYALAEEYQPAFFFIESAWKGNYGSWQYRVAHYDHKPGPEVAHICQYARQKGIPTLFWNKEDPVHHEKFMCSAGLADHIFTTDANMKDSYRAKTGNRNVHALPFAAQPALHKPAPLAGRKPRACFAGSWYGNRHAERGEAMRWLLQVANQHGLDIYDRNHGTGIFPFPEEYKAGIKGSLPYKELCEEYGRYRIFLNVNSVTDSPTMFSRRVFELMACGTPVVSTYAKGIENLFESDAVWLVNSREEADEAIRTLMNDDTEWRRRSLAGIREVFARHTYAHRLNDIFDRLA